MVDNVRKGEIIFTFFTDTGQGGGLYNSPGDDA